MYFIVCPAVFGGSFHALDPVRQAGFIALFQAGWFIESMWTQTLVMQTIRTAGIPFIQSRASVAVLLASLAGVALASGIPFTVFGEAIGLEPLPAVYFAWLFAMTGSYLALVTLAKKAYIRKYREWL